MKRRSPWRATRAWRRGTRGCCDRGPIGRCRGRPNLPGLGVEVVEDPVDHPAVHQQPVQRDAVEGTAGVGEYPVDDEVLCGDGHGGHAGILPVVVVWLRSVRVRCSRTATAQVASSSNGRASAVTETAEARRTATSEASGRASSGVVASASRVAGRPWRRHAAPNRRRSVARAAPSRVKPRNERRLSGLDM